MLGMKTARLTGAFTGLAGFSMCNAPVCGRYAPSPTALRCGEI